LREEGTGTPRERSVTEELANKPNQRTGRRRERLVEEKKNTSVLLWVTTAQPVNA